MKILLACAEGMSTSLLATRMNEFNEGNDIITKAVAERDIETIDDIDVLLLGPQIWYRGRSLKKKFTFPVAVMPRVPYGFMRADFMTEFAQKVIADPDNEAWFEF